VAKRACKPVPPVEAAVQGDRHDSIGEIDELDVCGHRTVRRSG
jgi:hypothetical protein